MQGGTGQGSVLVLGDFQWDPLIEEGAFSLDVPPGYTVRQPDEEISERDLVRMLRLCAEKSGGAFPARVSAQLIFSTVLGSQGNDASNTADVGDALAVTQFESEAKDIVRDAARGLTFIERIREKGTWSYLGGGVRLGDAQAEVCWWTVPGSTVRRVIYGDLQIRDAPVTTHPSKE